MAHPLTEIDGQLYCTQVAAAEFCGVTQPTLMKWCKEDNPPPKDPLSGLYPLKELGEWSRNRQIHKTGRGGGLPFMPSFSKDSGEQDAPVTLKDQEVRLKTLQADKIEMELRVRAGELVETSDVEGAWANILTRVRSRLRGVPTKLAPLVHAAKDVHAVQKYLEDGVREALEELSEDWNEDEDHVTDEE